MLNSIRKRKKPPSELLGLDFAATGVKAVKLRYVKGRLSLSGVEVLPAMDLTEKDARLPSLEIPRALKANYACACVSNGEALAKMLSLPGQSDPQKIASQVKEQFKISDDYRISSLTIGTAKSKSGSKLLAAAIPEAQISKLLALTADAPPALKSCEISSLAALQAFLASSLAESDDGLGFVEMGETSTNIFFVHRKSLVLMRQYDIGSRLVTDRIVNDFHVDRQTAANIMTEGAIDLSSLYSEILGFIVRQAVLSKDFVERQEKCKVGSLHVSGGISTSDNWLKILEESTAKEVTPFNPFDDIAIEAESIPQEFHANGGRFSAAIGATLGEFGIV